MLVKQFIGIFVQVRTTDFGPGVWFIPCIFCSFIVAYVILKISNKRKIVEMCIACGCLIGGWLWCTFINIKLPWGLDAAFVAVFFMILGNIYKEKLFNDVTRVEKKNVFGLIVFFIINCVFAYLNYKVIGRSVGMWSNNYGNLIYFLGGALSGIITVICFTRIIGCSGIQKIGKNSMFYYGMHAILIGMSSYITGYIPGLSNDIVGFFVSTVLVCIVIAILKNVFLIYKKILLWATKFIGMIL